jgi:hypothetical protein
MDYDRGKMAAHRRRSNAPPLPGPGPALDHAGRRQLEHDSLTREIRSLAEELAANAELTQADIATRLGWSQPRVSQALAATNPTTRSIADLFWAIGYRVEVVPVPLTGDGLAGRETSGVPPSLLARARRVTRLLGSRRQRQQPV